MSTVDELLLKHKWPILDAPNKGTPLWGYTLDEENMKWIPIPTQLDALEVAKELLANGLSTRECVTWLSKKTGKTISHQGFIKRIKRDNKVYEDFQLDGPYETSSEDYGDGVLHLPSPKPNATPKANGRKKFTAILKGKTPEERQIIRKVHNITEAKKIITRNTKQLATMVKDGQQAELVPEEWREALEDSVREEINEEQPVIIFQPNKGPQTEFLSAIEDVVFYGGAKGGGKSYALVADPVRYFSHPKFRGLITRRTRPELMDMIDNSKDLYKKAYPGATYNVTDKIWTFPSGAKLEFGYCETEEDAERYRGRSFHWGGIDEVPQFAHRGPYDAIASCIRSTDPELPTMLRLTGNPGNIGSQWVKEEFIDPAPPNTTFYRESTIRDPRTGEKRTIRKSFRYIPATVYDNPYLLNDDSYLATLALLPEVKRKQLLEGNWDVVDSGAFPEFDRSIHVVEPFEIPDNWLTFRAADWGYSSPFCLLYFAVDFDENMYVFHEWYGQNVYDDDWAEHIVNWEKENRIYCQHGVIDGSIKTSRGSRAPDSFEVINKILKKNRLTPFRKADRSPGSRKEGKLAVHRMLALKETGRKYEDGTPEMGPSMFIFNNCVNLIRTLPTLMVDKNDPEMVMKKNSDDHCFDALQYGIRSHRSDVRRKFVDMRTISNKPQPADPIFGY